VSRSKYSCYIEFRAVVRSFCVVLLRLLIMMVLLCSDGDCSCHDGIVITVIKIIVCYQLKALWLSGVKYPSTPYFYTGWLARSPGVFRPRKEVSVYTDLALSGIIWHIWRGYEKKSLPVPRVEASAWTGFSRLRIWSGGRLF
jgi:hypothetical protein